MALKIKFFLQKFSALCLVIEFGVCSFFCDKTGFGVYGYAYPATETVVAAANFWRVNS